jgi:hypothetical protein
MITITITIVIIITITVAAVPVTVNVNNTSNTRSVPIHFKPLLGIVTPRKDFLFIFIYFF